MADGKTVPGANLRLDEHHHWRELYKNLDVEGSWSLSGNIVTLTVELYDGLLVPDAKKVLAAAESKSKNPAAFKSIADNLDKPMELKISDDGKTLTRSDPRAEGSAVYTRETDTPLPGNGSR